MASLSEVGKRKVDGDEVAGDEVGGDKVGGDKVAKRPRPLESENDRVATMPAHNRVGGEVETKWTATGKVVYKLTRGSHLPLVCKVKTKWTLESLPPVLFPTILGFLSTTLGDVTAASKTYSVFSIFLKPVIDFARFVFHRTTKYMHQETKEIFRKAFLGFSMIEALSKVTKYLHSTFNHLNLVVLLANKRFKVVQSLRKHPGIVVAWQVPTLFWRACGDENYPQIPEGADKPCWELLEKMGCRAEKSAPSREGQCEGQCEVLRRLCQG